MGKAAFRAMTRQRFETLNRGQLDRFLYTLDSSVARTKRERLGCVFPAIWHARQSVPLDALVVSLQCSLGHEPRRWSRPTIPACQRKRVES